MRSINRSAKRPESIMNPKKLHIVCLDVPYPADHGGMFDLFHKLVALHHAGVSITLHCFDYGKGQQEELNQYCSAVYYYKRKTGVKGVSLRLPYIVSSRIDEQLVKNLSADNLPILLEGTHCSYMLYQNLFPGRKILYRLHNIEQLYYQQLFRNEKSFSFRKVYYWLESRLLKRYETEVLSRAELVLPVSEKDSEAIKPFLRGRLPRYIPVFLPFQKPEVLKGMGHYCLYQGNLSVSENEEAALWLAENFLCPPAGQQRHPAYKGPPG